ncbi:MAG: CcoQ/FixQ family Cbb3-type cytochrome c oxidase assembly chaperone [Helicobacteraceae bacterium]|nr:CcoQ/FixQ family Cbb3-type cytochrome c oxidase assembly chaperone [Helicobacteraceae bacterium]
MDWTLLKGYTYFFAIAISAILLMWYIYYLYINKARRERYEEYSKLVLNDGLDDEPVEPREDRAENPKDQTKDKR